MVSGNKIRQLGLGTDMRELRLRSGMSTRAVADKLGVSRMAVHRTESGKRTVPAEEVIAMCALYGVTGRDRERLVERATRGDNDASWLATGPAFHDQFRSFVALEAEAASLTHVSMIFIPGLLQTPEYMCALTEDVSAEAGPVMSTRLARQSAMHKEGAPTYHFIIDELALRRPVGGRRAMCEQLDHLVDRAASPNVTIQIMPAEVAASFVVTASFVLVALPGQQSHVYIEAAKTGVVMSAADDVRPYVDMATGLRNAALSEQDSLALIKRFLEELSDERTGLAQE